MTENEIGAVVVDFALSVHRELGPGLFESVYEAALAFELRRRGLRTDCQCPVPIKYKGKTFDAGLRADIIVEGKVVLESKSVETVAPATRSKF